ncbi:hypothetical protein Zmor_014119 [Zophobas morio]|uniref:Uncharacterized protein n=1 Tax=Zophobas morio TaxID=2755281 RepID=A0AA38MGL5_9CUCU|nr:hypothetical protein Zmor_014119 [Zophobas morio]
MGSLHQHYGSRSPCQAPGANKPSTWTYRKPSRFSPSPPPTATRPTAPSPIPEFRRPPPKHPSLVPPPAPTPPRLGRHSVQSCYLINCDSLFTR